jgi:hypothetical protein
MSAHRGNLKFSEELNYAILISRRNLDRGVEQKYPTLPQTPGCQNFGGNVDPFG